MPFDSKGNMSSYAPNTKKVAPTSSSPKNSGAMPSENDGEMMPLSKSKYPQLANAPKGSKLKGMWEGTVSDDTGDTVQVALTSMDIETENPADAEYNRMRQQGGSQENTGSDNESDSGEDD